VLPKSKACNFIIIKKGHDVLAETKGYMQTKLRTNEVSISQLSPNLKSICSGL